MVWGQSMGHKGTVMKPRCIGTEEVQTHLLFYSILFYSKDDEMDEVL